MSKPNMFSCLLREVPATGCVFPIGVVCIVPDSLDAMHRGQGPWMFNDLVAAESSEYVKDIVWHEPQVIDA